MESELGTYSSNDIITPHIMVPLELERSTSRNSHGAANGTGTGNVAVDGAAGDVLDGVVVGRGADVDATAITLEDAVDPDTVDAGVCVGAGGEETSGHEGGEGGDLHGIRFRQRLVDCKYIEG